MNDGRTKLWARLQFKDPSRLLVQLRPALNALAASALPEKFKKLRTGKQKTQREIIHAALFTHGLSVALELPALEFAMSEDQDYDCVTRYVKDDTEFYTPVQLKELVPESLNSEASLEEELGKLQKYTDSSDLVVAYFLNRTAHFPSIRIPQLKIGGLWFYGCSTPDASRWILIGDCLRNPEQRMFRMPS